MTDVVRASRTSRRGATPRPGPVGTRSRPFSSSNGSVRSSANQRRLAERSPGSVNPRSDASANVGGAAEAGLEHAAAPHRDAAGDAQIVDPDRFGQAPDPTSLDVDDRAGAGVERRARGGGGGDRLVEADRRAQPAGQLGVAGDVVLGQGLFDQEEVEIVEPGEMVCVVEGVRGVGVDLQEDVGTHGRPQRHEGFDVGARLDLALDPAVSLGEVALDHPHQFRPVALDPDRDAGIDRVPLAAEVLGQGTARPAQVRVEERHLHRGFGHGVALDVVEPPSGQDPRQQVPLEDVVSPGRVLGRVGGFGERHALAPSLGAVARQDPDQDDVLHRLRAERRPEGGDERQLEPAELEPFDVRTQVRARWRAS